MNAVLPGEFLVDRVVERDDDFFAGTGHAALLSFADSAVAVAGALADLLELDGPDLFLHQGEESLEFVDVEEVGEEDHESVGEVTRLDEEVDDVVREVPEEGEVLGHLGFSDIRQRVVRVDEDEVELPGVVLEGEEVLAVDT